MQKQLPKIIIILGPTASGKTELGIRLAKKFDGEIISADSRTVYKEINIGTAKPRSSFSEKNLSGQAASIIINDIPHYMIDILDLKQKFTVAQFKRQAIKIISDIHNRNKETLKFSFGRKRKMPFSFNPHFNFKIPFIVGGTMLYISALIDNFAIPHIPPDKKLRKKLENMIAEKGLDYAYHQLIKYDPGSKNFVQRKNPRRVIRALEVCIKTKKSFSKLRKKGKPLFNAVQIGIHTEREKLYDRINKRVDNMIEKGLLQEVIKLYQKYPNNLILKNTICYQEFLPYLKYLETHLEIESPSDEALWKKSNGRYISSIIEEIKKNTRRYARRQLTWWKKDKRIKWVKNYKQAEKLAKKFLT